MPTAGTHITIVQRLALDPTLQPLLGDPLAGADQAHPADTLAGRQMRFANLGAVGPDVFYAMADYGPQLQGIEDFLIKVAGTFEAIADVLGQIQRYIDGVLNTITLGVVDQIEKTVTLITGIVKEFFLALLVDNGLNLWPFFEAKRQQDRPRTEWFWADYLHYIRTGRFVRKVLDLGIRSGNPNLKAYALGYLTHYVTDVVGHPYVNQIVQAPWRMYWQRHHLVENFIDAYVWDRWHVSNAPPAPPSVDEQRLDKVIPSPNTTIGSGAPFTFARLNDLISIGIPSVGDPIDKIVTDLAHNIAGGGADLGINVVQDPPVPTDADFVAWTAMMAQALKETYGDDPLHPRRLLGPTRPDGFPTRDDIGAAYGVIRFFLKLSTEDRIQEPQPPNMVGDISQAVQQLLNAVANDIGSIRPPPLPSLHGHFSLSSLWDAIKNTAEWVVDTAAKVVKTVFDTIRGLVNVGLTAVSDVMKFGFFLVNKALFALYRHFRDVLVLAAYNVPFTNQLAMTAADKFNTTDLWQTRGNLGGGQYPVEEIAAERPFFPNSYAPIVPPNLQTAAVEQQPVVFIAPYTAGLPDLFIDAPRGPDELFSANGPLPLGGDQSRNFGGAIENCKNGILLATGNLSTLVLPNYNLDGDRGYAWPCWRVDPEPTDRTAGDACKEPDCDPLDPTNTQNAGTAHVKPVLLDGIT